MQILARHWASRTIWSSKFILGEVNRIQLVTYWADLGGGSKGQNSTLSEQGHVAYQIKENHKCSNIVANVLPADPYPPTPTPPPPPDPGYGGNRSNFNFSEHGYVAYPKGITK